MFLLLSTKKLLNTKLETYKFVRCFKFKRFIKNKIGVKKLSYFIKFININKI